MKNPDIEARVKALEVGFKHLSRRGEKATVGIIPPTVISTFVQKPLEDGTIFTAAMFEGKIKKGLMVVGKYFGTDRVGFTCRLVRPDGEYSTKFETKKQLEEIKLDIDVEAGDIFEFKIDDPLAVEGIWVSFLFDAKMGDKTIVKKIKEQLE